MFAGQQYDFEGYTTLPRGYSNASTWRIERAEGSSQNPADVAKVVRSYATGCTVKTLAPGYCKLVMVNDDYPDAIRRSVVVRVIRREPGGTVTPNPDDDVDTDPGDGDGSGGSSGGRDPEYPDPDDPNAVTPKVFSITVDGKPLGSADVMALRASRLRFGFASPIERYRLSAVLEEAQGADTESYAVIENKALTGDGRVLNASFLPKRNGTYLIGYSFEARSGLAASGDFTLRVRAYDGSVPVAPDLSDGDGGSGGCDAGLHPGLLAALIPLCLVRIRRSASRMGRMLLIALPLCLLSGAAWAGSYVVTSALDDLADPPAGSLRSVLNTIHLMDEESDVVYFDPSVEEIVLEAPLSIEFREILLDGYTGRSGKRVTLKTRSGGYRHMETYMGVLSMKGLVFQGFGEGSASNVPGEPNGGVYVYESSWSNRGELPGAVEDCRFAGIVGPEAAVVLVMCGMEFDRCVFEGNRTTGSDDPGALRADSDVVIHNSLIANNTAKGGYGAIRSGSLNDGFPSAFNTVACNREMLGRGRMAGNPKPASVAPAEPLAREPRLHRARVAPPREGGNIGGFVTIRNSSFLGNETEGPGGAVYANARAALVNCTVYGNASHGDDPLLRGEHLDFLASLFADNAAMDSGGDLAPDASLNLFADFTGAGSPEQPERLKTIFEQYPIAPEMRGGYVPVIPVRYAGPADGRVSGDIMGLEAPYPLMIDADARGVPRNFAAGAAVGAYGFGDVSLEPGNIQNSRVIAFPANASGSVKVKLVERVGTGTLSMTNYLGDIPILFSLQGGKEIGPLPGTANTADNGRAFVAVDTGGEGESVVRASVGGRPGTFLDLTVRVGGSGSGEDAVPDDLYVVFLNPEKTAPGLENTYIATFSRPCASSTVSVRRKGTSDYVERGIPVVMGESVYGTLGRTVVLPEKGSYMFDFAMTDSAGRRYEDTKEVKAEESASLKVFKMSEPPYYEDKTLSMIAVFSRPPAEIAMSMQDGSGVIHKADMYNENGRTEWEGFLTLHETGYYTAVLEYVDGGDGSSHVERFSIHVADYYGEGVVKAGSGGGGCASGMGAVSLLAACVGLLLIGGLTVRRGRVFERTR